MDIKSEQRSEVIGVISFSSWQRRKEQWLIDSYKSETL